MLKYREHTATEVFEDTLGRGAGEKIGDITQAARAAVKLVFTLARKIEPAGDRYRFTRGEIQSERTRPPVAFCFNGFLNGLCRSDLCRMYNLGLKFFVVKAVRLGLAIYRYIGWGLCCLFNFDVGEMEAAESLPGGGKVAVDQVLYNLQRRGIERRLLPWCRERGVAVMAYSPLEQGRLRDGRALARAARRHGVSAAAIAIAWTIRHEGIVTIPKASSPAHVRENAAAVRLRLTEEDLSDLDRAFPPPDRDEPLETL